MAKATLRKWLTEGGFDWAVGRIIYQDRGDSRYNNAKTASVIAHDHAVLDKEFSTGYGGAEAPDFIAEDGEALYFPDQYDGSTSLVKVFKNIDRYLDINTSTPYPGG